MRRNLLLAVLACGFGSLASADIIQLDKNCGGDCDNVLFKTQQTGNPVFGFFNNDDTKEVEFSSLDGSLLITGAAGQATIEGDDLDDLVIQLNGFTAEFFELNLDGAGGGPDPDSTLSITFNIL